MSDVALIYLDDYKGSEEHLLNDRGIDTLRMSHEISQGTIVSDFTTKTAILLRSNRMTPEEFDSFWLKANSLDLKMATSPKSYRIISDFAAHYPIIRDYSPKAVVANAKLSNKDLHSILSLSDLEFPVFLRSELESAAKYVGVDGCVIRSAQRKGFDEIVENLRQNVSGFETLIFKEMIPLQKRGESTLEYRCVGACGKLLCFDFQDEGVLPSPESLNLDRFATTVISALAAAGADGTFFLDVSITQAGSPTVVECKNFNNGSIRNLDVFANALLRWNKVVPK